MFTNSESLSQVQNDFLPPIGRWTNYGAMFVLCLLGIAIPAAAIAKYKVTVKAQAVVRPAGELKIVQAATEGTVININAQENQVVKAGDAIATIDDSKLQTKKSQLQSSIQQAKLQLVQFDAQMNAINNQIRAEGDRINRTVAAANAELSDRLRSYEDKKITSVSQAQEADANIRIAQEELHTAQAQLKSTQANLRATQAALGAAKSKSNRYGSVAKAGALSSDQLEEAQLAVKQQEQAVSAQAAAVEAQKQTIQRLQQGVSAAVARRKGVQAALNPSHAEVAIATEKIAQEQASGKASLATLTKEREALIHHRIEASKQMERDTRELQQVNMELSQTTIKATADGTLFKLNLRNSHQTVRPGEEIAQIAPSNSAVILKAVVEAQEITKVKLGQKVHMRVSACAYPDYGTLKGKVTAISPDAIAPQSRDSTPSSSTTAISQKVGAAGAFYEVSIEPATLILGQGKRQCTIQLGMDGRVDIISREETVLQFFLRKARLIADV